MSQYICNTCKSTFQSKERKKGIDIKTGKENNRYFCPFCNSSSIQIEFSLDNTQSSAMYRIRESVSTTRISKMQKPKSYVIIMNFLLFLFFFNLINWLMYPMFEINKENVIFHFSMLILISLILTNIFRVQR